MRRVVDVICDGRVLRSVEVSLIRLLPWTNAPTDADWVTEAREELGWADDEIPEDSTFVVREP